MTCGCWGGGVPRQEQVPPVPGQMLSCSCELSPPALGGPTLGAGEVRLGLGSGLGLFRAGWVGPLTHLGLQGLQSTCPGPSWSPSPPTVLHPYVASPPPIPPQDEQSGPQVLLVRLGLGLQPIVCSGLHLHSGACGPHPVTRGRGLCVLGHRGCA